jgi:ubiquinone/menaquinone biosynthesis C-methylase UbiE
MIEWIIILSILIIVSIVGLLGSSRSKVPREVGFAEGIDDAAVVDAFSSLQELPQFKMIRNKIVDHVISPSIGNPVEEGSSLLDLGCGTGHLLKALHETIAKDNLPKLRLFGIDIGAESVRVCQEKLAIANITDVEIKEGDGASMPYLDDSVDVVVTSLSLHHWTEPVRVLDEIYRILHPNGLLVLFDMRRDCKKFWHYLLRFATRVVVPKPLRKVREPLGSLLASYTEAELHELLSRTKWAESKLRIEGVMFAQVLEIRK